MWTAKEAAHVLREERAAIMRSWQADARVRLWHLDKALFTKKGRGTRCIGATLSTIAELLATRQQRKIPAPGHCAPPPEPLQSLTPPPTNDVDDPNADIEADVIALTASERASTPRTGLEALVAPLAAQWLELPITWNDARVMLEMTSSAVHSRLIERGADNDTLLLADAALDGVAAIVADAKLIEAEGRFISQREELALSQHLAGRFLANASHELRTPLTAILGFADLLLEETYGVLNPEQRIAVGHVENSAQNLLEVINNLLDLLRIRSGKISLQFRPILLGPILTHIYAILMPLAERKSVTFVNEIPDDLGSLEADESIVKHVVYHLLASALRATPAGGAVTLRAERTDEDMIVTTHDTALHLPNEAIANMVEIFPLLENSPARGYEGWEVGLPLVRRYVELHDGELQLESDPDAGTTFRIVLPLVH